MANFGRRMVNEELIAQIGQGGTEYTAGDNITIEDGVISAVDTTYTASNGIKIENDDIQADTTVLATTAYANTAAGNAVTSGINTLKDDNVIFPYFDGTDVDFTDVSYDDENTALDISNIINALPLIQSTETTDFADLTNEIKITTDQYNEQTKSFYLKGYGLIKATASNQYLILITKDAALVAGTATNMSNITAKEFSRSGGDAYMVAKVRASKWNTLQVNATYSSATQFKINGVLVPFANVQFVALASTDTSEVVVKASVGIKNGYVRLQFGYPGISGSNLTNYGNKLAIDKIATGNPGNYLLRVTVDANSKLTDLR